MTEPYFKVIPKYLMYYSHTLGMCDFILKMIARFAECACASLLRTDQWSSIIKWMSLSCWWALFTLLFHYHILLLLYFSFRLS